jgi:hypothetical protein
MHRLLLLLLAGAMLLLCCLGLFLCFLLATTSDVPGVPSAHALARANVGHVDRGTSDPASNLPDGSYLLTPAEEAQETDKAPVNASLLTMLVLAVASFFGTSVGWVLMTNARGRRGAMCCSGVDDDRAWLAVASEGASFLGVFRL